jgi:RNA polymerase sigma-70 factor (ECF subfamily)
VTDRPETALLDACREGDRAAWTRLYRQQAPVISRFLQRLLGPERDLEDLVQQVFVEFFSSLDRFRGEGSLATWLYGIATHVAVRHRRFEFRWRRRRTAYGDWLAGQAVAGPDPAAGAEARAFLACVGETLGRLDVRQRSVWVLREWEGLSTEETATALGIPEGTVRFRLCMARRALSRALAEAGLEAAGIADRETLPATVVRQIGGPARR